MTQLNTKIAGLFAVLFLVGTVVPVAHAQTTDVTSALVRMDAIIAEMQKLRAEFASLASAVATQPAPVPQVQGATQSRIGFTQLLEFGETNDDIAWIQRLLATDPEIYPYGVDSGFFGPKTQEAIRNLQSRFGLDPVGVVGPATRTILEAFLAKYPEGNFPANVLAQIPQVTTSAPLNVVPTPTPVTVADVSTPVPTGSGSDLVSVEAEVDRGEAEVKVEYRSKRSERFIVNGESSSEIARAVAKRTGEDYDAVVVVLEIDGADDDNEYDDNDAEDAIDDADEAIDDADDEIDEADDDGEEVGRSRQLLDEAEDLLKDAEDAYDDEDWDEAVELAEEAEDLAKDAEDVIGEKERNKRGDSDEIDEIEAEIDDGETKITVRYDDGDDYEFEVDEDKEDEIIEAVAEELDLDEDDVQDLIEFDYGDVDEIDVTVDEEEGEAEVRVTYESGVVRRFTIDADDESDMIEEIADEIDEDEDDVEEWTDFDY